MEKSNLEKAKDVFVYAPVGAFGFIRDNAPTFYSMFVSRGRKEVTKTTIVAEEKITNTKHHGQIIAMGSDVAKDKAEKATSEAKEKGTDVVQNATEIASELIATGTQMLSGFISSLTEKEQETKEQETKAEDLKPVVEDSESNVAKATNSTDASGSDLPESLKDEYERLSAPEIIDRIKEFSKEELHSIIKYELSYRNRQTIIHAVNHRLLELD